MGWGAADSLRLLRNSLTLSAGTVIRLSIGFLTWLAAARLYPASEVGIAAGAISAMLLCIQGGTVGIDLALIALFPEHRLRPAFLLDTAITLSGLMACVAALSFLGLTALGLRALDVLSGSLPYAALFLGLTVLQAAWWLLDQASVAFRRGEEVLARAVLAGAVTLGGVGLLGALGLDTAAAILAAWLAAALAACTAGIVQMRRNAGYRFRPRLERLLGRRLLSVGLPNFALTTADVAPVLILPIVAGEVLSPSDAAYWYAVWMMALAAYTVPASFGLNFFAEVSDAPSDLARHAGATLRSGLLFAVAAGLAVIVVGPFALSILGPEYAERGSGPLRLAAVAATPIVVVKVYLYTCRATARMREGTGIAAISGIVAVVGAALAADSWGLTGMAATWLVVQVMTALAAGVRLRRLLLGSGAEQVHPPESALADVRAAPLGGQQV